MIVNYFEPSLSFDLPPEDAINHFTAKGLQPTWNWYEMMNEQHDVAFTVAKMMDTDLLSSVKGELEKAIANGTTLDTFKQNLIPLLQQKGWWGAKDIVGPDGTVSQIQLGSASRLENIFLTNMQSAYAAGHWAGIQENAADMPYLMYDAVDDGRTRPEHAANDGKVYRVDAKFWLTHFPPNGYRCRCGVIQLDEDGLKEFGLTVSDDPVLPMLKWKNPQTGEVIEYPLGTDPSFNHNSGIHYLESLKQTQSKKIAAMAPDEAAAATKGAKAAKDAADKAKAAQKALEAEKAAGQAIAKAKAKANAQAELDTIAKGEATKQAGIKKKLLEKYQKNGTAEQYSDDPEGLLAKIVDDAAQEQAKKEKASALSGYKKKVLDGKNPTNSQQKVFDNLTESEKAKVIADIDKKKAKQAAALEAEQQAAADAATTSPAGVNAKGINTELKWENMKQTGGQAGSNEGGFYYDVETGKNYYIKRPRSEAAARNEVLAAKLYEQAGIEVPNVNLMTGPNGEIRVASEIIDGLTTNKKKLQSGTLQNINDGFAVDAWLANWDVVGLGFDNMMVKGGKVIRIDTGGALKYRAQGSLKGELWNNAANEIETLRNAELNPQAASVFANVTDADIRKGVARITAISDEQIEQLVKQYAAPADQDIAATLIARKKALASKYGVTPKATPANLKQAEQTLQNKHAMNQESLDNAIMTAVKGMKYAFDNEGGYRQKDLSRINDVKNAMEAMLNSGDYTASTKVKLRTHYQQWLDTLQDAYNKKTKLPDSWFSPYSGSVSFTDDAISAMAEVENDLPKLTNKQGNEAIANFAGLYETKVPVKQNGDKSLQQIYRKLTQAHKRSISMYTGDYYSEVNRALYQRAATPEQQAFIELLNEALEYSDKYDGISTRAIRLDKEIRDRWLRDHRKAMKSGEPVKYLAFTSSTKGAKSAFGGHIKIVFHSKKGVYVNPISRHAGIEDEVLFKAGSNFYVQSVTEQGSGMIIHVSDAPDGAVASRDFEFMEAE